MIELNHVTKLYENADRPSLDCIDLRIDDSEFVFLVGPSGAGKSTILSLLYRDTCPNTGSLEVDGFNVPELSPNRQKMYRRFIGYVRQVFQIDDRKTVFENVASSLRKRGANSEQIERRVFEVLGRLSLTAQMDSTLDLLSEGEERLVAIATAIAPWPSILLLDEPTANLDPFRSQDLADVLAEINDAGATIVVATSHSSIVDVSRQRVVELDRGRIARDQRRGLYSADN
jgi:cell division transport system ATP-binding protein